MLGHMEFWANLLRGRKTVPLYQLLRVTVPSAMQWDSLFSKCPVTAWGDLFPIICFNPSRNPGEMARMTVPRLAEEQENLLKVLGREAADANSGGSEFQGSLAPPSHAAPQESPHDHPLMRLYHNHASLLLLESPAPSSPLLHAGSRKGEKVLRITPMCERTAWGRGAAGWC